MKQLVLPIAAMLVLSTTFAEAGKRHVRKVVHQMSDHIARGRFAPAPIYFGDRPCISAAARDPYIVCFPGGNSPYVGRDPDINVRFDLRRDGSHGN
jgi:hypothetical protein